jgi:DNA-binding NarL/FixJ family response regulator
MLLTEREKRVFRLVIDGQNNSQIADALGMNINSVRQYKKRVMLKYRLFGFRSLNELIEAFVNFERSKMEAASESVYHQAAS